MPDPIAPANDFAAQWAEIRADGLAAVDRVGRSGWLILGEEVRAFEREFAEWWGMDHAVGVASGLDALEIALRCMGIGPGDRVLTTPLTAFATTLAVLRTGAEPVWVDVDASGGLNLDAAGDALESDPAIRALLPVHLYGHPLDPNTLADLADRFGVAIVEDCAQSAGATRAGTPTGRAGRIAATSFYPTKNLGAYGDGGALLTNDGTIAKRARTLRDYGQEGRYNHAELGLNSRLDEVHAAILRSALLPRLDGWLRRREEIAIAYREALSGSLLEPVPAAGGRSAHHLFPTLVTNGAADEAAERLARARVGVGRHYPALCPDQPACVGIGVAVGDLANARQFTEREVSLPLNPHLSDAAVEHVIETCQAL